MGMHSPVASSGASQSLSLPQSGSGSGPPGSGPPPPIPSSTASTSLNQHTRVSRISLGHQDKSKIQANGGRPLPAPPPPPTSQVVGPSPLSPNAAATGTCVASGSSAGTARNASSALQKSQTRCGNYQQSPIMKRQNMTAFKTASSLAAAGSGSPGSLGLSTSSGPCPGVGSGGGVACAPVVTLDSIVTEYLRKQHALCKNPVVTCPPFDLFM